MRFDVSVFFMLNGLFIFFFFLPFVNKETVYYQKFLRILFVIANSIALLLNCIDFSYFKFTLKRTTSELFFIRNDVGNLLGQYLIDYWYIVFIWMLLTYLLFRFYPITQKVEMEKWGFWKKGGSEVLSLLLLSGIALLGIRGGFQLKPLRIITAAEYTDSRNIPLLINTPFSVIKSIRAEYISVTNYFPSNNPESLHSFVHPPSDSLMHKQNVVLIILESFSKEYIGYFNRGKGYTPFLDSLLAQSVVYEHAYANGKKSIEGIPAIIAGIPSLMENPYLTSVYGTNQIEGLGSLLKKQGYSTSFFHGGSNGTMGFDVFAKLAGFENYYGRNEYANEADFDGNWGIYDEAFYSYFASQLTKMPQPFCSVFFSLSSHHPYSIPEKYKKKFPKGTLEIHQSIAYADYSLKKFFATASHLEWFNNTLFVITADHTSLSESPYYQNKVGSYAIPLFFYSANLKAKKVTELVAQQIDILPTLLDKLNYPRRYFAYGNSLEKNNKSQFTVNFSNGVYQSTSKTSCLQFDGEKTIGFYNLLTDSLMKTNLVNNNLSAQAEQEKSLKKFIQHFNQTLIENKMTVK